ncbi:MAG: hypothetical protein ACO3HJ_04305 [Methylophilaceae bacterium]
MNYTLRQNPHSYYIPQEYMYEFATEFEYIQCPWSYLPRERVEIRAGNYPNKATRIFIDDLKIGERVVLLYKGLKKSIYAEVVSDPIYDLERDVYARKISHYLWKNKINPENYNPIVRKIRVIKELDFTLKRQQTMCRILNRDIIRSIEA